MQLTFDADVEAFRADFIAFLDEYLPDPAVTEQRSRSTADSPDWARAWQRAMFDHGWLLPGNPPEFGGRNASILQQYVHRDELSKRRIYQSFNPQGLGIIAASLLSFGTDEQKQRWAVPILPRSSPMPGASGWRSRSPRRLRRWVGHRPQDGGRRGRWLHRPGNG